MWASSITCERAASAACATLAPLLIAGIALGQASGMTALLRSHLFALAPRAPANTEHARAAPRRTARRAPKTAQALLHNNWFDWSVDLNPQSPDEDPLPTNEAKPHLDLSDPLVAQHCSDTRVTLITQQFDPTSSVALLSVPGEDRPSHRRVGEFAGKYQVAYIGFNHLRASPAVWLINEATLCQALMFTPNGTTDNRDATGERAADRQYGNAGPVDPHPSSGARQPQGGVPKEIRDRITKVSETEFSIERSVVDHILEHQADLMKTTRLVPLTGIDGNSVGVRLSGVDPNTLLGVLGLQNGDSLERINGFDITNPEGALNAYARLRSASQLSVQLTRRGQPTTLNVNIR